tara:strand:- start:2053 stop:2424 length:372 start_codon:yes stop_codon:yes gene_type:complete
MCYKLLQRVSLRARIKRFFLKPVLGKIDFMVNKKSKYRHVKIGSKTYYFYRLEWVDITGDAGHASVEEFDKFECSKMITHAYIYKKTSKFVWTFASYEEKDVSFSDRNIFPVGCIVKMERILL